jgi:uncharacterized protein (TIGR00730 family)
MTTAAAGFSVCVYCGSRRGQHSRYADAARALGRAIGERRWQLVYGGGRVGLMGELADAVLGAGGRVVGVIPESLMRREVGHTGLSELHVVPDMHARKRLMAERARAFIALPGGIGTFEELFEVWSWAHLGYHDQPIGLLDVDGFFEPLMSFLRHTVAEGFIDDRQMAMLRTACDPGVLLDALRQAAALATGQDDYSRT